MATMDARPSQRRPSLYITIRLARLVQNFRERLKARIKSRAQREALLRSEQADLEEKLQADVDTQTRYVQFKDSRNHKKFSKLVIIPGRRQSPCLLLKNLDHYVAPQGTRLTTVASHDRLLLDYDARDLINCRRIEQAGHVLDITTLLLDRLQFAQRNAALGQLATHGCKIVDEADREKYIANLEHLLRCLQQAALDALIQHSLDALESDYHHWDRYLEQQRRLRFDWFTEWPSGRPPLSSTMPWNIKPSLVVLWGVCWMFYMTNRLPNESRQTHDDSWAVQQPWVGSDVQNYNVQQAAAYVQSSLPPRQPDRAAMSHPGQSNRSRSSFGSIHGPVISSADMIGSLPSQALQGEGAMSQNTMNHMIRSPNQLVPAPAFQAVAQPRRPRQRDQPATRQGNTHIIRTSEDTTNPLVTSAPDVAFATQFIWNQNTDQSPTFVESHNDWQPSNQDNRNIFPEASQQLPNTQQQLNQLAIPFTAATSRTPVRAFSQGYNFQNMSNVYHQIDYPSPGSSASEQTNVVYPPVTMAGNTSPNPTDNTSPRSTVLSPQQIENAGSDGDPPRNMSGQIYCNHLDCAQNPPVFLRKCEWSKHMDKHTRPYICREPGCEKIRGFTYSGGLLRHEREVHRQHGGPKAPRFCPFPNCKRSTGQGFSRKENLNEHLRRVHRDADVAEDDATISPKQIQPPTLPSSHSAGQSLNRKRKRPSAAEEEDDDDDDNDAQRASGESVPALKETIKTLRMEISARDTQIHQLQEVIKRSTRALQGISR